MDSWLTCDRLGEKDWKIIKAETSEEARAKGVLKKDAIVKIVPTGEGEPTTVCLKEYMLSAS